MKYAALLLLILPGVAGCGEVTSAKPASSHRNVSYAATVQPETAAMPDKVVHTEEQWRQLLTGEQYDVLRAKGTERPFLNEYDDHFSPGVYACAACGQELFSSQAKFNSGCGWPAFYAARAGDRVELTRDLSHGMVRIEVTCSRCDSHLGHVFDDAPHTPTGERYCINSAALEFIPASGQESEDGQE